MVKSVLSFLRKHNSVLFYGAFALFLWGPIIAMLSVMVVIKGCKKSMSDKGLARFLIIGVIALIGVLIVEDMGFPYPATLTFLALLAVLWVMPNWSKKIDVE